jgi:hypothetical protein
MEEKFVQNLTITVSPDRAEFIKLRAAELGLGSPDEFMCRLLDAEVRRCDKRQRVEAMLLEGVAAGMGANVNEDWWDEFDREVFGHTLHESEL